MRRSRRLGFCAFAKVPATRSGRVSFKRLLAVGAAARSIGAFFAEIPCWQSYGRLVLYMCKLPKTPQPRRGQRDCPSLSLSVPTKSV